MAGPKLSRLSPCLVSLIKALFSFSASRHDCMLSYGIKKWSPKLGLFLWVSFFLDLGLMILHYHVSSLISSNRFRTIFSALLVVLIGKVGLISLAHHPQK